MSGVVLRCSTCGTTQNHPGGCETCGEGKVRYYCGNHTPGVWIDGPACGVCGARFGQMPSRPPEPTRPFSPQSPAPPAHKIGGPVSRPASPRRVDPPRPERGTPSAPETDPEHIPPAPSLGELIAHLARERTSPPFTTEDPLPGERRGTRERSAPVLGCLLTIMIFVILLIVFALGGCF